jgi:hypothetical protein
MILYGEFKFAQGLKTSCFFLMWDILNLLNFMMRRKLRMRIAPLRFSEKVLASFFAVLGLSGVCFDVFDIAQGTGNWIGKISSTWALIFGINCLLIAMVLYAVLSVIWRDQRFVKLANTLIDFRKGMGRWRWLSALLVFVFPIWLFQYSVLGIVLQGLYIRLLVWVIALFLLTFLISEEYILAGWKIFLIVLILTTTAFSVFASLRLVSGYPFSIGWSEGNRLWDYSIMFGRARYDFPSDQAIFVFLEPGRQLIGGIPFLIPGITISLVRTWVALLYVLPFMFLGVVLFRSMSKEKGLWMVLAFMAYIFLNQAQINPSLIFIAVLVVLAWRSPLWISLPLVMLSGYFSTISRFTWIFAPALWLAMLEFSDAIPEKNGKLKPSLWFRVILLCSFSLLGGLPLSYLIGFISSSYSAGANVGNLAQNSSALGNVNPAFLNQSLLWYRLLPNSTYPPGILGGVLLATGPLVFLLYYFGLRKKWPVNGWQKLSILLPLIAFLAVGLVASVKIGGGGDLHNMDMYFIGLLFCFAVVWDHGGRQWVEGAHSESIWIKIIFTASMMISGISPLLAMRSYNFIENAPWLVKLTDAPNVRALEMYPAREVIDDSLKSIQTEVNRSAQTGEVLFMDQRQLLTFGFISRIPLVPDYDKKVLIDRALSSNSEYFGHFYKDLADRRFSLIITQPLTSPKKGSSDQFGEENNAWVKWVADPLLCFYEVHKTLQDVNVQLLVPRPGVVDCSKVISKTK